MVQFKRFSSLQAADRLLQNELWISERSGLDLKQKVRLASFFENSINLKSIMMEKVCNIGSKSIVMDFDPQGKKVLKTMEKYYLADHGIREAILESNQRDIQLVLENLVFLEMKRRGYEVRIGKVGAQEVDFVGTKGGEKLYIQVSYLLASPQTIEREFGVFNEIHDNFPKFVVSMDELDFSRNGYHHWNIRDFLLAESWT